MSAVRYSMINQSVLTMDCTSLNSMAAGLFLPLLFHLSEFPRNGERLRGYVLGRFRVQGTMRYIYIYIYILEACSLERTRRRGGNTP